MNDPIEAVLEIDETTLARIKVGLRRLGCSRQLKAEAIEAAIGLSRRIQSLQYELDTINSLLSFQSNSKITEYTNLRIFKVEDGETHWYAARTPEDAIAFQASLTDMTVDEYVKEYLPTITEMAPEQALSVSDEDNGMRVIKTCAEWANAESDVSIIATTCT